MKDMDILYFSGTGNARKIGAWMQDQAMQRGLHPSLIDIAKHENIICKPDSSYIFIAPTHGFNYPPIMLYYILRFPRACGNNSAYLMNTRAGMKLYKLFLPGLSGIALIFSALVLFMKGYKIRGMRSFDMPSNWISLHPGLRQKVVDSIFIRCERKARKCIDKIIDGQPVFKALISLPLDLAIAPVAVLYFIAGRFFIAKTFVASHDCTKCGLCVRECPVQAISFVAGRPFWSYTCESCMKCMNSCPQRAIETAHGFIIGAVFLLFSVVMTMVYDIPFIKDIPWISEQAWSRFILENTIGLAGVFILYRIVHYLKRYTLVDKIITYTSFTRYRFWRRFRG